VRLPHGYVDEVRCVDHLLDLLAIGRPLLGPRAKVKSPRKKSSG
jgi:hypothetical protein